MAEKKGTLSINSDNIFPIIKKWLYSDHDIFFRELISNGCDAITKLKKLDMMGEYNFPEGHKNKVEVILDPEKKTLKFIDTGLGMTADEVEKYITQIAFSGATQFLEQYKDKTEGDQIIGHFGLGFYSAFMVADKVTIDTLSYKEGSKPVHWESEGGLTFEMKDGEKAEQGTTITLYLNEDSYEFSNEYRAREVLEKYCSFMPVPIFLNNEKAEPQYETIEKDELTDKDIIIETIVEPAKTEEKENEKGEKETAETEPAREKYKILKRPVALNDTTPLWSKHPNECTDEEYRDFYRKVFHDYKEPLFWIHLNVDYPFNLTGILYFPRIKSNIDLHRNKIQLYCNQVFVTDSVEGIVPEFLTLLHGVLDSPDIPLNVSRSYLQSDQNVKKISNHITKKVADRLEEIFKNDRPQFEEKWDSLKLFIQYGMLTDEKFYDRAVKFALFKDVEGKYFTFEEYKNLIKDNQTDKEGNLIYLYTTNKDEQYSYIQAAKDKGYSVLEMDGQLDVHLIGQLEQKFEKSRFVRVDSDTIDNLIRKEDSNKVTLSEEQKTAMQEVFKSQMPKLNKTEFYVTFEALGENANPVMLTQSEYMRRMREMSAMQPGMSFYGEMPDSFNFVLNTDHPLIKKVLTEEEQACDEKLKPILSDIKGWEARQADLREAQSKKKEDEITAQEKEDMTNTDHKLDELREQRNQVLAEYAGTNKTVSQLIDLALLGNGMLKGEALSQFIKRSVELIG